MQFFNTLVVAFHFHFLTYVRNFCEGYNKNISILLNWSAENYRWSHSWPRVENIIRSVGQLSSQPKIQLNATVIRR